MLRKRLVGVVTVKDGWAVQSFGYKRYLPLGRPECLVENLDRWGADEILVLSIDRTRRSLGPDLAMLSRLSALGLSTPLAYGGGISTVADAASVVQLGAERVCVDAALRGRGEPIREMSMLLGAQAVIAALPVSYENDSLCWLDYQTGSSKPLTATDVPLLTDGTVSEALLIDWRHEGERGGFDTRLVHAFPLESVPVIVFGGLSEPHQINELLSINRVVATAVGNFLSYSEHAIQSLKQHLTEVPLRPAVYSAELT